MKFHVQPDGSRGALRSLTLLLAVVIAGANGSFAQEDLFGPADGQAKPTTAQATIEEQRQALYELQQKLIPLLRRGKEDHDAANRARALEAEIAERERLLAELEESIERGRRGRRTPAADDPFAEAERGGEDNRTQQAGAALEASLAQTRDQLLERDRQVAELSQQLTKLERTRESPPIEDAEIKVFSLVSVKAPEVAKTLESLFGAQIRVAIDERTNALIVFGKGNALQAVEALLLRLDQSDSASPRGNAARSLLLRVFWLADGLPKGEGQDAQKFLPAAVIKATERLGLEGPRLVTQTVNSLALGQQPAVPFSTQVPATVFNQPANLNCKGQMRSVDGDRAAVDIEIQVTGWSINCQLSGSLATPLRHYMVLGTANSVISDPATMAGMGMMGGGYGGYGEGGYGGRMGYGRGGYGGEGGTPAGRGPAFGGEGAAPPVDPATGLRGPEANGEKPAEPKYATSRFAFVVQVIEGESYTATTPSKTSRDASRGEADNDPFK